MIIVYYDGIEHQFLNMQEWDEYDIANDREGYKYKKYLHREGGPAVITDCNKESWFFKGQLHRIGDPAVISNSGEQWYKEGKRHREGGPAVIDKEYEEWYLNGQKHRIGGPAAHWFGSGYREWWIHNKRIYSEEEYNMLMRNYKLDKILK